MPTFYPIDQYSLQEIPVGSLLRRAKGVVGPLSVSHMGVLWYQGLVWDMSPDSPFGPRSLREFADGHPVEFAPPPEGRTQDAMAEVMERRAGETWGPVRNCQDAAFEVWCGKKYSPAVWKTVGAGALVAVAAVAGSVKRKKKKT